MESLGNTFCDHSFNSPCTDTTLNVSLTIVKYYVVYITTKITPFV